MFLKLIWNTNRPMAGGNIILRILQAGVPVTSLYLGKLIIDEVLFLSCASQYLEGILFMLT